MRLLAISLLLALSLAIEEPDPISEEEQHDEVAQAQQRAKWLACMLITRAYTLDGEAELEPVLKESKHDREKTLVKIRGDIMYKCSNGITAKAADKMLAAETIDMTDSSVVAFLQIDKEALADAKKDISLTKEQQDLYAAIKEVPFIQEMNRTDDGYEVEPPIVKDFDPAMYSTNELGVSSTVQQVSLAAGGAFFLGLLFVCTI